MRSKACCGAGPTGCTTCGCPRAEAGTAVPYGSDFLRQTMCRSRYQSVVIGLITETRRFRGPQTGHEKAP